MTKKKFSRRGFISLAAAGAGGFLLLVKCASPYRYSRFRIFSESEAKLVDAIADQIIPPGEWPGGKEAGVTYYIDKQLSGSLSRFRTEYQKGLRAIQETSMQMNSIHFEFLPWKEQTAFLKKMEAGEFSNPSIGSAIWEDGFDRSFFRLLRDHSMQGFYGSPRHGGNINHVSYRMIGLDYPLIIGQNRYI